MSADQTALVVLSLRHNGIKGGGAALEDEVREFLAAGVLTAGALVEVISGAAGAKDNHLMYLRKSLTTRITAPAPAVGVEDNDLAPADVADRPTVAPPELVHFAEHRRQAGGGG